MAARARRWLGAVGVVFVLGAVAAGGVLVAPGRVAAQGVTPSPTAGVWNTVMPVCTVTAQPSQTAVFPGVEWPTLDATMYPVGSATACVPEPNGTQLPCDGGTQTATATATVPSPTAVTHPVKMTGCFMDDPGLGSCAIVDDYTATFTWTQTNNNYVHGPTITLLNTTAVNQTFPIFEHVSFTSGNGAAWQDNLTTWGGAITRGSPWSFTNLAQGSFHDLESPGWVYTASASGGGFKSSFSLMLSNNGYHHAEGTITLYEAYQAVPPTEAPTATPTSTPQVCIMPNDVAPAIWMNPAQIVAGDCYQLIPEISISLPTAPFFPELLPSGISVPGWSVCVDWFVTSAMLFGMNFVDVAAICMTIAFGMFMYREIHS